MASEKTETSEKLVTVRLPRAAEGEEKYVFVGVNGQGWRIERGKAVEVPACVAEVLRNADLAQDELDAFISDNQPKYAGK